MLSDRRIAHMSKKPLTAIEFVQPLATMDPVYKEEEDSFKVQQCSLIYLLYSLPYGTRIELQYTKLSAVTLAAMYSSVYS